jgi:hypothetical protein
VCSAQGFTANDSTCEISAELQDISLGGTCASDPSAGVFLFKVLNSNDKQLKGKKILVIIQCANGGYPGNFFKLKSRYFLTISPERPPGAVRAVDDKFVKVDAQEYYLISIKRH